MTRSHLPRRTIVGAVLATALIGGGLVTAFADDAPAAGACPSWTDPKGDATTGQGGIPNTGDDQMDIVTASLANDGANVVATIGDVKMGDTASDFGDEFAINFTLGGKEMQVYSDRGGSLGDPLTSPVGFDAGFYNITDDLSGAATAKYDTKASTVTITGTVAELNKALGSDATGKVATAIVATTQDYMPNVGGFPYDDAATKLTFTVGADCAGGDAPGAPAPAPVPSVDPAPAPVPGGAPAGACPATYTDPAGDSGFFDPATGPLTADEDLDIVAVTHSVDAGVFRTSVKVAKLAEDGPLYAMADRFITGFTVAKKAVEVTGERDFTGFGADQASVEVEGTAVTSPVKLVVDLKANTINVDMAAADFEKAIGAPLAGEAFSAMTSAARAVYPSNASPGTGQPSWDLADAPATASYKFGAGCGPAVPPLSNVGALKAQYGDIAAVAAKLVDAGGAAVAGKTVTFTLGASKATGVTGADGVAKGSLLVKEKAGKRSLVITSDDAKTTVDFTVLVEKTALKAVGGKGGVTATLTDDDKKPVAGQVITFASGSKKMTAKTNAQGVAKVTGLPPGNIKVTYAGAPGMYAAASTTTKS